MAAGRAVDESDSTCRRADGRGRRGCSSSPPRSSN